MKELLLSFDGRINRTDFWKGVGIALAFSILLNLVASILTIMVVLSPLVSLFTTYMLLAVTAKRYHDQGKSGWWGCFWFIPAVGWLFIFIECGTVQGRMLKNQYGDPV